MNTQTVAVRDTHPLADIFPPMTDSEFAALKSDINANGLREPIWVDAKGTILDGRHRYRACGELAIECESLEYIGEDVAAFVISLNLHRRHLNESQRALVAARLSTMGQGTRTDIEHSAELRKVAQPRAAELLNTSTRAIQQAKRVEREAPELIPMVQAGALTLDRAEAEIKKRARAVEIEQQRVDLAVATPAAPQGLFHVISVDPPWPYGDGAEPEYDPLGYRASNPYPELSLEEIAALKLPAADDCVLWLWTTHRFMRHAFGLLDGWGFQDRAILTWVKDRMGLGRWLRSQSEFCIMATKGRPLITLTNQTTVLHGPLREHSRKPDEFYAFVDTLCAGRKLDFFSRERRQGWEQFGNDTAKFAVE